MKTCINNFLIKSISRITVHKARYAKNVNGYYNTVHSGYAFKYSEDLSDSLNKITEQVSKLETNIIPIFIDYKEETVLPFSATSRKMNLLTANTSLIDHLEQKETTILFTATGLSSIYRKRDVTIVCEQILEMINSRNNVVILADSHPDFFKLISAEDQKSIKNKYHAVLPCLINSRIISTDLDGLNE